MLQRLKNSRSVRVATAMNERYGDDSGGYLASSIGFYGFLSLFPLLLVGLSVVGFVLAGRPDLQERVAGEVAVAVPGLEGLIGDNLDRVVTTRAAAGVVGLVGVLWSGTAVVGAARDALRRIFRQPRITGFVQQKLWLLTTTVWLGAVALVATGTAAVIGGIRATGPAGVALLIAIPVITAGLDFLLFLVAYRVLLRRRVAFRPLVPGAILAAIGWSILKVGGAWYASRTLTNSSAVYGTFAAAVAALLLLYLAARLFVYGAELNAVLMEGGGGRVEGARGDGKQSAEEIRHGGAGPAEEDERSTAHLVRSIGTDVVDLMRKEIELAKLEVREGITARLKGIVALAVAGVFALFGLGFLAGAAAFGLDVALQPWASRLIVGGAFLVVAAVAAVAGLKLVKSAPLGPRRTRETIKEDVEWARAQLRR